jgi:pilus assembly protein CpaE
MPAFIVCDHDATASRIRDVLTFAGRECPSSHVLGFDEATARLSREPHVDVLIVALPSDSERGLAILASLTRSTPGKVLAVGPTADAKLVLRALRSGAVDYVDIADLEVELESALRRMVEEAASPPEPGCLIAVLAPNGGSGSSTLAVNLAASLAAEHKSVGLLDLKLQTGDLAALLDLRPTFTLADLCQNAARLDRVMFERSLVKHEVGVHMLAPPQDLHDVGHVRPDGVSLAVSLARASFPFVVADVDHTFHEEQMVVLREANVILIVLRLDFASLRNVRRTIEFLEASGIARDKLRLVVNRSGQSQEVPRAKAEEALGMKIAQLVPEDAKLVNRSNNQGVPVVIAAPSSKVARSIAQLAKTLAALPRT